MRLGPLIAAFGAGSKNLQESNARERAERERRELLAEQKAERARREAREGLTLDVMLRDKGYIPEGEAGPDASVSGRTLDQVVTAATGTPTMGMRSTPTRYGGGPEGYRYDRMNPQAERQRRLDAQASEGRSLDMEIKRMEIEQARNPRPTAPVPGTPEYFAMKDREAEIAARHRPVRPPAPPRPTEWNHKAAFMMEGAKRAAETLRGYAASPRTWINRIPGAGNYGLTEADQVAQQAAETLHDAYLRITTGATINKDELRRAAKQYIPEPGDTPGVLRAKAVRRAEVIRAIDRAAAPAVRGEQGQDDFDIPNPDY